MATDLAVDLGPVFVGLYIRVSMAREEMISPELQMRDILAYLRRKTLETGREHIAVLIEQDLDASGKSFARDGIQRLMTGIRDGVISMIASYRYDRFGRNLEQALVHVKEVESLGGQVVSVTEPIDVTTAVGNYMRSNTFALAELQSKQIGEGWKRVHQYRLDRGLPTNGRERYGYLAHRATQPRGDAIRICPQGCGPGECETGFVPDPETAPVVQWIYDAYVGGKGFQAIAHALNAEGTRCPGVVAAARSGNPTRVARNAHALWTAGGVIDVADTGFAAGLITHNSQWYPGAHEPLISPQVWSAYQVRREAQRLVATKTRSAKWSLAGIAVCGSCGGPMYCSSSPRGEQYALYCGTARIDRACRGNYRTRAAVEGAVALWLQSYAAELEAATRTGLEGLPARRRDPFKAERQKLLTTIERADSKISRLLTAYTDEAIDLSQYKQRRDEVQDNVDLARRRLAQLDEPTPTAPTAATVGDFAQTWTTLDPEPRRDIAKALLIEVRVRPDKTVEIRPRWSPAVVVTFTRRGTTPNRMAPITPPESPQRGD